MKTPKTTLMFKMLSPEKQRKIVNTICSKYPYNWTKLEEEMVDIYSLTQKR